MKPRSKITNQGRYREQGFSIDFSSNLALSRSLQHIADKCHDDPEIARLMKTMATIAMNEAGWVQWQSMLMTLRLIDGR